MQHVFGYARVSAQDQNLATQLDALSKAGCSRIFQEKITGTATSRPALDELLGQLRAGDTVIVSRFFRLGRSSAHLIQLIEQFHRDGIIFKALDLNVDSSTPSGKLVIGIFAALAEYQREELLEKTKAGRELAKERGTHMGRRRGVDSDKLEKVKVALKAGMGVGNIVRLTGVSESSVKRYKRILHTLNDK